MDSLKSITFPNKGKRKRQKRIMLFSILKFLFFAVVVILLLPVYVFLSLLIFLSSGWPVFFVQKRVGKDGLVFQIYKFRTMINGAEKKQIGLKKVNEADGPVFKIRNDPRYTKIGKFLSHSGLDELPQLFNVLKGEMNFIGPRPLPVEEEKKINKKYRKKRSSVKPGILSPWVLNGYHKLPFNEWMKSDLDYVKNESFIYDMKIVGKSAIFLIKLFFETIQESLR